MQVRVVIWIVTFIGIVVHWFQIENINIAILAMVKNGNQNTDKFNTTNSSICIKYNQDHANETMEVIKTETLTGNDNRFDWSKSDQNLILGAGHWFTTVANLLAGLCIYQFGAKNVFTFSAVVCIFSSIATPLVAFLGPIWIVAIRAVQGFFSSLSQPVCTIKIISKWAPIEERGRFMSIFIATPFGASLGYILFGIIIDYFGWQYSFYVSGISITLWLLSWCYLVYDSPEQHPSISEEEKRYINAGSGIKISDKKLPVPWKQILTSWPFYLVISNHFGFMWTSTVINVYTPTYFREIYGYMPRQTGVMLGISYFARAILCYIGGVTTDMLIKRKVLTLTNVRKLWTFVGNVIPGLALLITAFAGCNEYMSIAGIILHLSLSSFFTVGTSTSIIDLSPNFCEILQSICSFISFSSGIIIVSIMQFISLHYDSYEQWYLILIISAVIEVIPGILFILVGNSEIQKWNFPAKKEVQPEKVYEIHSTLLPKKTSET